jgi:hypothetical protein
MSTLQFVSLLAALRTQPRKRKRCYGPKRRAVEMTPQERASVHLPHEYIVREPEPAPLLLAADVYHKPLGLDGRETLTAFLREGFSTRMKWAAEHGLFPDP